MGIITITKTRREGIRRNLARAICELLMGHKKTVPNVMRYVIPYLKSYRIRDRQVKPQDILVALELVRNAQRQNPIQFMNSFSPLWADKRKDFFLNSATLFSVNTGVTK